ncbi:MAG: hypothetical protein ACRDSZ_14255 [Pseudonocardiaceae bacterium]
MGELWWDDEDAAHIDARFVLTLSVNPEDWSDVTAWKTRRADLRDYLEGREAHR